MVMARLHTEFLKAVDEEQLVKSDFIHSASVPVIKLKARLEAAPERLQILNVDVTFDSSGGLQSAIASVQTIKELQMKHPTLRSLVICLKKLLAKHGLNKPYSGGLNSYSIVLMASTFLNTYSPAKKKREVSQNLIQFLQFYGVYFDCQT